MVFYLHSHPLDEDFFRTFLNDQLFRA